MKNNNVKKILCTGAILGVVGVSGIMAYLTDSESKTNYFTVGNVDIVLEESLWSDEEHQTGIDTNGDGVIDENDEKTYEGAVNIVANQTITKDPKVKNNGKNPAYVYLKVTVPVAKVVTTDGEGNKQEASATPLFTYDIDSNWGEIGNPTISDTDKSVTHIYYYKSELSTGSDTSVLFKDSNVKFANITEEALSGDTPTVASLQDIKVEAMAIQSDSLELEGVKDSEDYIKKAYEIYVNQNK